MCRVKSHQCPPAQCSPVCCEIWSVHSKSHDETISWANSPRMRQRYRLRRLHPQSLSHLKQRSRWHHDHDKLCEQSRQPVNRREVNDETIWPTLSTHELSSCDSTTSQYMPRRHVTSTDAYTPHDQSHKQAQTIQATITPMANQRPVHSVWSQTVPTHMTGSSCIETQCFNQTLFIPVFDPSLDDSLYFDNLIDMLYNDPSIVHIIDLRRQFGELWFQIVAFVVSAADPSSDSCLDDDSCTIVIWCSDDLSHWCCCFGHFTKINTNNWWMCPLASLALSYSHPLFWTMQSSEHLSMFMCRHEQRAHLLSRDSHDFWSDRWSLSHLLSLAG